MRGHDASISSHGHFLYSVVRVTKLHLLSFHLHFLLVTRIHGRQAVMSAPETTKGKITGLQILGVANHSRPE